MNRAWALLVVFASAATASAQPVPTPFPGAPVASLSNFDAPPTSFAAGASDGGFLVGDRMFPNFIGFMSNPIQNIDPRSMTVIWPIFGASWVSPLPALPQADMQVYGAGITVALSDRLAVGLNQGGGGVLNFQQGSGFFRDRFGKLQNLNQFGGQREGWLDLGGFAQYTLIANCEEQFLLTGGMRWVAPSGSSAILEGYGPVMLSPYATIGKGWGDYHMLATTGYQFPAGSGGANTNYFYANVHFDRKFGWIYPLIEFNFTYHQSNVDVDLPTRIGLIDQSFSSSGNFLGMAVGANAVLVPNKVEFGAVYTTSLATQRNLDVDGIIVKMVFRY